MSQASNCPEMAVGRRVKLMGKGRKDMSKGAKGKGKIDKGKAAKGAEKGNMKQRPAAAGAQKPKSRSGTATMTYIGNLRDIHKSEQERMQQRLERQQMRTADLEERLYIKKLASESMQGRIDCLKLYHERDYQILQFYKAHFGALPD